MKNKAFTLIEIMAIIVIIASIALVSFPILTKVMKNNEKLEEDTFKENAIKAAKTYCNLNKSYDENGNCSVSISKLIEGSYLDKPTIDGYDYTKHVVECNNGNCDYQYTLYPIGKEIVLNNEKYNVIGEGEDYVTLLKQEPLTVAEVNANKIGSDGINHVNKNTYSNVGEVYNYNGWGGMAYYSSSTCGCATPGGSYTYSGCTTAYDQSDIKYVVEEWARNKFTLSDLKTVDGYAARLVQKEELRSQFYPSCSESAKSCNKESTTPSWLYAPNYEYWYWTMSPYNSSTSVWYVHGSGGLYSGIVFGDSGAVRPVINVYKSVLENS